MKKMNNKGFVLVETLIVTVFVVTLFIFVYRITLPSIGEYEQQNYYDDIDSVYYSNLYKQMFTRYANIDNITAYLNSNTYMDISNCADTNLYSNNNYCQLVKNKLSIKDDDKVLITEYNIKKFKDEVKRNDFFDSGTLSNFRDYINTVSNYEPFYSKLSSTSDYIGKFRLFIVRTVEDADGSTSRRYSNIGIYTGTNAKFLMGEKVIFNPGDGNKEFYVLANSNSIDPYVTLILAQNLPGSSVCFNAEKTSTYPNKLLDKLKTLTAGWSNVAFLTDYNYTSSAGYTINYNGYRARLLEEKDIYEFLGCKEDNNLCYDPNLAFEVDFDKEKLAFLVDNLTDTNGYWTGIVVPNSDYYAWSIMNGKVIPTNLNDCTNIGIRPVIKVEKANVQREV